MNIKKGDNVKMLSGKDRGKTGKVAKVSPSSARIMIEGLNIFKKHARAKRQGETGQMVQVSRSVDASNVMLICPSCKAPTRVGHRVEGKRNVRFCKKCKSTV